MGNFAIGNFVGSGGRTRLEARSYRRVLLIIEAGSIEANPPGDLQDHVGTRLEARSWIARGANAPVFEFHITAPRQLPIANCLLQIDNEVSLPDNTGMMQNMARQNIADGIHGDRLAIGDACRRQLFIVKRSEQALG